MRVRFWIMRYGEWRLGWIVRYTGGAYDEAEIAPDAGGHVYLCRGAVEGYERLWRS